MQNRSTTATEATCRPFHSLHSCCSLLSGFFILSLFLCTSCSNTKYLPEGEKLYTGAKITINDKSEQGKLGRKYKKKLKAEMETIPRPRPNTTLFGGLRPGLWFYNIAGKPKGKGLRYFIRNKLGEAPVYFSQVDLEKNRDLLKNRLENRGHFRPDVFFLVHETRHKRVSVEYVLNLNQPYHIAKVFWPEGDSAINRLIRQTRDSSLINPGSQYDLDKLKQERERITDALKDKGLFYFSPDFILFKADSTLGNHLVNIYVSLKEGIPLYTTRIYHMDKMYIYPNHSLLRDSFRRTPDTTLVNDFYYVGNRKLFRPRVITESIFLKKGQLYTHQGYDLTLNRLMNLGTFKFVSLKFHLDSAEMLRDSLSDYGLLDADIFLTPLPRRSARAELRLVSKSNDFAGPALTLSLRNRNFLHGAELFTFSANTSFETLISGEQKGVTSYTYGGEAQLQLPRFYVPYFHINPPTRFVPRTILTMSFQQLSRIRYYHMNSFNFKAGYKWNETNRKQHELYPININFLQLGHTSARFNELLNRNYILRRSFNRQFVLGGTYTYTYNTQVTAEHKNDLYFSGTIDESGNLAYLLQSSITGKSPTPDKPYNLLGRPYSQYSIVSLDLRHYLHPDGRNTIASRLFAGAGKAYGNSLVLPYAKQFYTGGNNSIRAFRARSIGPGTYKNDTQSRGFFVDQVGDIRLEGNLEWRPDIYKIFKGAVFLDAGNIWLIEDDPDRPGGKFDFSTFADQLAVGTGVGLRIDASYFVLRFDLGIPLRKPYLEEGHRWVINAIKPGDPHWRSQNLVLNIGIGYPF